MLKQRPDYSCADCGIDTDKAGEYSWIVHDDLWRRSLSAARRRRGVHTHPVSQHDLTCIGCFERRIHRTLTADDFNWVVALNFVPGHRSKTLLARMGERLQAVRNKYLPAKSGHG